MCVNGSLPATFTGVVNTTGTPVSLQSCTRMPFAACLLLFSYNSTVPSTSACQLVARCVRCSQRTTAGSQAMPSRQLQRPHAGGNATLGNALLNASASFTNFATVRSCPVLR